MAGDISTVRLLIGDKVKRALNEPIGKWDVNNKYYKLSMFPLVSSPTASLAILISGVTAATNTYTISGDVGALTFTGTGTANAEIVGSYNYYALTSGELSDILSGHTGYPFLAAANAALILAADASRFFAYKMGEKSVDKRKVAGELRALSEALEKRHYKMIKDGNYDSSVFTMQDNSGTPYFGYDTAVAYLGDT